ncbi:MAG: NAD(P)H-hydrate dehydratase [Candidatus Peribacteraceae bacterium]|nr:NAD(P)H-hydrate dehydratase [Candidatus Peribacteraceae bacterium]MDD5739935.1 NAD(P)H-hydrate dehydratase [Candidatus Peribacteraceae bacterium]
MRRATDSHKGENGKAAIIGGSSLMHGAPLFAALAAEASGADLIFVSLPKCHAESAKATSLNFQVHPFGNDDLAGGDTAAILELLATMDCAVVGPGIAHGHAKSLNALMTIVAESPCRLILDATALQPETLELVRGKSAVLTPHLAELERMNLTATDLSQQASNAGAVIFLKGPTDIIAGPDGSLTELKGGNAGLTVGGTGDALAGLIAGLVAQGLEPLEAAKKAGAVMKRAAEQLFEKYGYAFGTRRVIKEIPKVLKAMA